MLPGGHCTTTGEDKPDITSPRAPGTLSVMPDPLSDPGPGAIPHDRLDTEGLELCQAVSEIHAHGWAPGTGGNFSVTVARDPLRLLITQTGRDKRRLHPGDDLVLVGSDGRPADGCQGRPSAETLIHCVLAEAAGAGSTLHTHSVAGTLLGEHFLDRGGFNLTGYEMLKGLEGVRDHQARVWVPILPNSQNMVRLAEKVRELLVSQPGLHGFLLAGHGLYTWGETLAQARRHVEIFEFLLESVARRTTFEPFAG